MIIDIHANVGRHPLMEFEQEPIEVLETMDKHAIDKSFLLPFPTMRTRKSNDFIARSINQSADRLVGFGIVDPSDDAIQEVRHIHNIGLKGVVLDPEFYPIFDPFVGHMVFPKVEGLLIPCADLGLPVLFSSPNIEAGDESRIQREPYFRGLDSLACKFQDVTFVVNSYWPRIEELMGKYPNIAIDSGGRNGIDGAIKLAQMNGPMRICFGSESPQNHPAIGIKQIKISRLEQTYKKQLLGNNAERIFKAIF